MDVEEENINVVTKESGRVLESIPEGVDCQVQESSKTVEGLNGLQSVIPVAMGVNETTETDYHPEEMETVEDSEMNYNETDGEVPEEAEPLENSEMNYNETDGEVPEEAEPLENSEVNDNDTDGVVPENKNSDKSNVLRLTRLPISRIKSIMKFDDDVNHATQEAIFLVTKATELFISSFMKEVYQCTLASKKKTVSKRDVDTAIFSKDCYLFLDGALD